MADGFENIVNGLTARKWAATKALMGTWAGKLESEAKQAAPWSDVTAHARGSIHGSVRDGGDEIVLSLAHGVAYGAYLETGTGIYGPEKRPIRPKSPGGTLHFWAGGEQVFAKSVKGMPAQPVIRPTAERNYPAIKRTIRELWRK
jgi:hypothetical protein